MKATKIILFFVLMTGMSICLNGQNASTASFEFQAYPTGIMPGISADLKLNKASFFHVRLGANIFDHRDLGVQETEEGSGFGFSLGYRRFFSSDNPRWRWGLKTDLWLNEVDWTNGANTSSPKAGRTDITVLQPSAELTYMWDLGGFVLAPNIAFGFEWNVQTDGEPTGEGAILLLGIQVGKKL